jgi:uncharacterized protein with LGFP repeats
MSESDDPARTPRSKLDFIYQEVLGEVGGLVGRLEAVSAQQAGLIEKLTQAGPDAARAVQRAGATASASMLAEAKEQREKINAEWQALAAQTSKAAGVINGSARRLGRLVVLLGVLSGGVAGSVICLLILKG